MLLIALQVAWDPWRVEGRPDPEYLVRSRVVSASRVLLESAFGWQWYLGDRVTRQSLGSSEFVIPGPLPPRASHTGRYTLGQLRRFTVPTSAAAFLRRGRDYAVYRRQYLAGPLGVVEHRAVQEEALAAGEERRGRRSRTGRSRERSEYAAATGLRQLSWTLQVRDPRGEAAEVRFEPARTEPAEVTGLVCHTSVCFLYAVLEICLNCTLTLTLITIAGADRMGDRGDSLDACYGERVSQDSEWHASAAALPSSDSCSSSTASGITLDFALNSILSMFDTMHVDCSFFCYLFQLSTYTICNALYTEFELN